MKRIISFLQENYAWITMIIAGTSITISFVFSFLNYIYLNIRAYYYGIPYEFLEIGRSDYIYTFALSLLMFLCCYSLCYCYKQLYDRIVKKDKNGQTIINIILILSSNILVFAMLADEFSLMSLIYNLFVLISVEIVLTVIIAYIFRQSETEKRKLSTMTNSEIKTEFLNIIKIIPFYLVLVLCAFSFRYFSNIAFNKSYNIIDDNLVIVNTTTTSYVVLNCEIQGNDLIIVRGNYAKINNENLNVRFMKFNRVTIK